jgi:ribonuclease P protein component
MTGAPRLRFRREQRLLHRADFDRVFAQGRRVYARGLVLHWMDSPAGRARLGLVTSRRFGNAVRRNRARRLVREAFRLDQNSIPPLDLVVLPQPGAFPDELEAVRSALREALARAARSARAPQAKSGGSAP